MSPLALLFFSSKVGIYSKLPNISSKTYRHKVKKHNSTVLVDLVWAHFSIPWHVKFYKILFAKLNTKDILKNYSLLHINKDNLKG